MSTIQLPGLSDVHVHIREPGATHKEDWDTGTAAALAGGITTVLAMPNTQPPITDEDALRVSLKWAEKKARCDYAQFMGAGPENAKSISPLAHQTAGLKMYLDTTYGELRLDEMSLWMTHFEHWPKDQVIAVHAEQRTLAATILMAEIYDRHIHICHVSRKEEILVIRAAKEKGIKVTCEVGPQHLFLTEEDIPSLGPGLCEVRPMLASPNDRDALWENLDVIDCIATDHAPHTLEEKNSENPPPGYPGLETALPLLLTAVHDGRLTVEDIVSRMHTNPRRIFNIPEQPETFVEVDTEEVWEIKAKNTHTRCGWTPFEAWQVRGKIKRVVLRGKEVYRDGVVTASPGNGKNIRKSIL
jgi:carbamoyl-phosphate synthase/aspartate carbamoyltransferase/dihydroorotase